MNSVLQQFYGSLLIMRSPAPVPINKGGSNYKSEVAHLTYFPRDAYHEWLGVCEAIVHAGGDALFLFEKVDDVFLDHKSLHIDGDGNIYPCDSTQPLDNIAHVNTGRVFTANGPWIISEGSQLKALLPNMLSHRTQEIPYYKSLLTAIAQSSKQTLVLQENPYTWEGLADIAVLGNHALLTYMIKGHYDENVSEKSMRSCYEGLIFAADFAGLEPHERLFAELIYPHFHGDTVHFTIKTQTGDYIVQYPQGLWHDCAETAQQSLGQETRILIDHKDAVTYYAGNSRQVCNTLLVAQGVSDTFLKKMHATHLKTHELTFEQLFGKAGGGPGCLTLPLPNNLVFDDDMPCRFTVQKNNAWAHLHRIPQTVSVDPAYFQGKHRG